MAELSVNIPFTVRSPVEVRPPVPLNTKLLKVPATIVWADDPANSTFPFHVFPEGRGVAEVEMVLMVPELKILPAIAVSEFVERLKIDPVFTDKLPPILQSVEVPSVTGAKLLSMVKLYGETPEKLVIVCATTPLKMSVLVAA